MGPVRRRSNPTALGFAFTCPASCFNRYLTAEFRMDVACLVKHPYVRCSNYETTHAPRGEGNSDNLIESGR